MGFLQKDMDELVRQMQADRVMVKLPNTEAHNDIQHDIITDLADKLAQWLEENYTVYPK